jgi:hypothetical protein
VKLYPIIFEMALTSNSEAKRYGDLIRQEMNQHMDLPERIKFKFLAKAHGFVKIGEGNGRIIYEIPGTEFIIKVAKGGGGIFGGVNQNKTEITLKSNCLSDEYFTKIYDFDEENYFWIICEKVQTGLSSEQVLKLLIQNLKGSDEKLFELISLMSTNRAIYAIGDALSGGLEIELNSWGKNLSDELNNCKMNADDFHADNWGLRADGSLVVLDYGA